MGVATYTFTVQVSGKSILWNLYDVGGARGQRHTWVPYFDDANAIIFLAPVSAFDQVSPSFTALLLSLYHSLGRASVVPCLSTSLIRTGSWVWSYHCRQCPVFHMSRDFVRQGISPTSVRIRPIALFGISCQKSELRSEISAHALRWLSRSFWSTALFAVVVARCLAYED